MSGAFGGYCYSDKPQPKCACGVTMTDREIVNPGMCILCWEWEEERARKGLAKLKPCKVCGHPFVAYRNDGGCCTQTCYQTWLLRQYHSERAKRWFVEGWDWMALDVMQQVYQELYPAPMIVPEGWCQMPMYNTFCVVPAVDRTLAPRPDTGKLPKRKNTVTQFVISSNLVMEMEDQNERAWNWEDRKNVAAASQ